MMREYGLQLNLEKTKIYNSWDTASFEFAGIEMSSTQRLNQSKKITQQL